MDANSPDSPDSGNRTARGAAAGRREGDPAEYYRSIIESIFSGFLIYGLDHHAVIDCNNLAAVMVGLRRENLIGTDIGELFPPGERERLLAIGEDHPSLTMIEARMVAADGRFLDVLLSRGVVGRPEENLRILNVLDISHRVRMEEALRKSRKRYHELYENVPSGLFRTTVEGAVLEANQAVVRILGYPDEISLHTINVSDLYADPADRDWIMRELAKPGSRVIREVLLRTYAGDEIWCRLTLHRVVDPEAGMAYIDGVVEDISDVKARESEQKAVEAIRNRMQRMEAIETLTGGIAHEFNNILTGLSLHLQLVSQCADDAEEDVHRREMEKLIRRGVQIVDGLLTTLGTIQGETVPVDLEDAVEGALEDFGDGGGVSGRIRRKRHGESLVVEGSAEALRTAIREVVANALTASGPDGVVEIATDRRKADPRMTDAIDAGTAEFGSVEIRDTGPGMDGETVDRILEPYFTTEDFGEGKGLGLTRAYGIVKQHNGYFFLDSRPGEGTVADFYFPLAGDAGN